MTVWPRATRSFVHIVQMNKSRFVYAYEMYFILLTVCDAV